MHLLCVTLRTYSACTLLGLTPNVRPMNVGPPGCSVIQVAPGEWLHLLCAGSGAGTTDLHRLCVDNWAGLGPRRTYYAWTAPAPLCTYYACADLRKQRSLAVIPRLRPGLSACLHPHR